MGPVTSSPEPARVKRSHVVDLSPLRESPAFRRLWVGNAISGIGGQMTLVAVGLHIYAITGSTFAVSLVGALGLGPMIIAGLYGGMLADAFDRRLVALISAVAAWASTIGLASLAWGGVEQVWPFYVLTTVNAVAATMVNTVRAAIVPRIVEPRLLPAASALTGISTGTMITVGPALAGVLVASVGFAWTYTIDVVLFLTAFAGILSLPPIAPEGERRRPGLESLRDGFAFLRTAPNIRMSFFVDIVAMTFGNPRVLFPAAGALVLGGGPVTVGVLTAASAVGTLVSGLFSGQAGQVRMHGVAITRSIQVYGLCIAGFGAVLAVTMLLGADGAVSAATGDVHLGALIAAAVFLAGSGASDNISGIYRTTMLQTAVPDHMRGRLQGIFTVVVTGGPRVGDLYIGLLASAAALWVAPLLGGILVIALVSLLVRRSPGFRRYDALAPTP
jgi:MFS family permease